MYSSFIILTATLLTWLGGGLFYLSCSNQIAVQRALPSACLRKFAYLVLALGLIGCLAGLSVLAAFFVWLTQIMCVWGLVPAATVIRAFMQQVKS
jgi:hypothetical protein